MIMACIEFSRFTNCQNPPFEKTLDVRRRD